MVEPTPDARTFPFADLVGFAVEPAAEPGRARATARVDEQHTNPHGVVHGAVLFALVDTAMGSATYSVIPEGCACASIEVHVRFLAPVLPPADLVADVRVMKAGRRVVQLDGSVLDGTDRLVATATGSYAVLAPTEG